MSYMGSLDVGLNIDEAAVESPTLLVDLLKQSFNELAAFAPASESSDSTGPAAEPGATKRRWWRRSR